MKRNSFPLNHYVKQLGQIGRLQTLGVWPVMAGDSIEASYTNLFRLSPLRRALTIDAQVDMFAFYIPHRHIYGDDWIDFIKQGQDETITLSTITTHATRNCNCLGEIIDNNTTYLLGS